MYTWTQIIVTNNKMTHMITTYNDTGLNPKDYST